MKINNKLIEKRVNKNTILKSCLLDDGGGG